ncbi:MAG TPA: hypothetical protein VND62_03465 [Acidimicrobiales bacterium]|nr:hypothetical protein [Acidimicrobiales bacterium]
MSARRRAPFRRTADGRIGLDLPPGVREFMTAAAERLRDTGSTPGSPGFLRLFGRIDESAEVDDPAYVLGRQLAIDEVVAAVAASAQKPTIDTDEAEAWLKVLGMTLSRRSAELGVRTDEDREKLDDEDQAVIRVAYALQVALMDVLDDPDG